MGRAARAGAFVVLALIALTLATPGTASADFACQFTGDDAYELDTPGANGESVFPAVNQWEDKGQRAKNLNDTTGMVTGAVNMPRPANEYTLYEMNGVRGLYWSGTQRDRGDASQTDSWWDASGADDCRIMDFVNNGIANVVFDGTKILTRIAISIKEFASNPSPLSGLYKSRDSVVDRLRENVFVPAVPVMITLTGIWVFGKWRKEQMREAWSGVGWAALTTVAVVVLLTGGNYDKFINEADSGIAQANALLTEKVLGAMSGEIQSPCDLPTNAPNRGVRISSCAMYDTLAFRPWALGQFGEGGTDCIFKNKDKGGGRVEGGVCHPADPGRECKMYGTGARCEDLRVRQVVSQSMTNKDVTAKTEERSKYKEEWYSIRQDIAGGKGNDEDAPDRAIYPVSFTEWAGKGAGNRIGLAVYSLIAALIVGIMVIVLSALTLLWHAVTLIMIIMLPLIASIGIHPSQQKLLKGWLQTFIHSFVLRAGFGVILTVLLVLYQMILPAKISLGMQLLMLLLVTVAVVMMLKKLLSGAYSPQIAGAQDALGVGDMANTVSGKLGQYASGAATGAAKKTGRVVAAGTAKAGKKGTLGALRAYDNKANDGRWQKEGKLSTPQPSKREQRKTQYQTAEVQKDQLEEQYKTLEAKRERQAAAAEQDQITGRLVGGGTLSAHVHRPRPAPPLPAAASTPAVPAQQEPRTPTGRTSAPEPGPVRRQPQAPVPDPRRAPTQPSQPQPQTPPPAQRDGEGGHGRVSE
ncbi:hypothetical protein ABT403_17450 [Streptomyces sp. NPDC000075]|uniref:hypothetical protein n=1 Tax=Streptomyces TaxID=1883 RepID=UPI0031D00F50